MDFPVDAINEYDGRRGPRKRSVLRMLHSDYLRCSGGLAKQATGRKLVVCALCTHRPGGVSAALTAQVVHQNTLIVLAAGFWPYTYSISIYTNYLFALSDSHITTIMIANVLYQGINSDSGTYCPRFHIIGYNRAQSVAAKHHAVGNTMSWKDGKGNFRLARQKNDNQKGSLIDR
jgi:hypothetical protein